MRTVVILLFGSADILYNSNIFNPLENIKTYRSDCLGHQMTQISPFSSSSDQRKVRERSSSESSWMERDEGADTPDSFHRLTPSLGTKNHYSQDAPGEDFSCDPPTENKIKLPLYSSSSRRMPVPSVNGEIGSEDKTL